MTYGRTPINKGSVEDFVAGMQWRFDLQGAAFMEAMKTPDQRAASLLPRRASAAVIELTNSQPPKSAPQG